MGKTAAAGKKKKVGSVSIDGGAASLKDDAKDTTDSNNKEDDSNDNNNNNHNNENAKTVELTRPLGIGDECQVRWRGGEQVLQAHVVERRLWDPKRQRLAAAGNNQKKSKQKVDLDALEPRQVEYYVHYQGHDRRLDEWITIDAFLLHTLRRLEDIQKELERKAAAAAQESANSKSRPSRRRSSSHHHAGGSEKSFSMSSGGGNWHSSGDPTLKELEEEHEEATKVKNINKIVMGCWEVEAWYYSPYPEDYSNLPTLYVCEYCLKYMRKVISLKKHKADCTWRRPPGPEIYRENDLSVFEVDGKTAKVYCQNLCLLAKLFLDHKTLYYDVEPFLFYIITRVDEHGAHIVGYFSKEKVSADGYNLACILTFPQYQNAGYGKFIISLSYELSKREEKEGSPEKPLSDLGKISYRSYWKHILLHLLAKLDLQKNQNITIKEISAQTGIKQEDIISTLQYLGMIKVYKGQHVVYVEQSKIDEYMKQNKRFRLCKPECLNWQPPDTKEGKKSSK